MTRYKGPWGHNLSSGEAGRRAVDSVTGSNVLDKYTNVYKYAEGGYIDDPEQPPTADASSTRVQTYSPDNLRPEHSSNMLERHFYNKFVPRGYHGITRSEDYPHDSIDREDAWKIYMGMNQEGRTFGPSDFLPTQSQDDDAFYLRYLQDGNIDLVKKRAEQRFEDLQDGHVHVADSEAAYSGPPDSEDERRGTMGTFTLSKGYDEERDKPYISYYDKWDLKPNILEDSGIGQSFEIYDRLYYNQDAQPGDENFWQDVDSPILPNNIKQAYGGHTNSYKSIIEKYAQ